ncbi:MAG: hypothetical protein GY816_17980 [Cytophagales bacterium]|nr:hypothetical protein [Cytophagales bacterium]
MILNFFLEQPCPWKLLELLETMIGVDTEQVVIGGHMGIPVLSEVYISGDIYYTGEFTLVGGVEPTVDVEVAEITVGFSITVSDLGFEITAKAYGEIVGESVEATATVVLDWETGGMEVCMDLPVVGKTCSTFGDGSQRTLNGRPYQSELGPISVIGKL